MPGTRHCERRPGPCSARRGLQDESWEEAWNEAERCAFQSVPSVVLDAVQTRPASLDILRSVWEETQRISDRLSRAGHPEGKMRIASNSDSIVHLGGMNMKSIRSEERRVGEECRS